MTEKKEGYIITSSPHLFSSTSTSKIMYIVIATLLPVVVFSVLLFGGKVLVLYGVSVGTAVVTELVVKLVRRKDIRSIRDGSAVITGLLLVMVVPPDLSPVFVALGAFVAIFIGKEVFGGLGANVFNPALVGRAFLSASYPVQMTSYSQPATLFSLAGGVDAASGATPLAAARFEGITTPFESLLFGQVGGSVGETSALLIIIGGLILIGLKIVDWRLVGAYLGTVFLFSGLFYLIDPAGYSSPVFHLLSGGLMLGAFYMATDMSTSPYTPWGQVVFGVGAGIIVVIIRLFGGFPEGVMYSILLMNAVTPLINRYTLPKTFGSIRGKGAAA
ncbi:MAG: RnfABCDGE type electron transport complex subunit D [Spirochaetota bacterium]